MLLNIDKSYAESIFMWHCVTEYFSWCWSRVSILCILSSLSAVWRLNIHWLRGEDGDGRAAWTSPNRAVKVSRQGLYFPTNSISLSRSSSGLPRLYLYLVCIFVFHCDFTSPFLNNVSMNFLCEAQRLSLICSFSSSRFLQIYMSTKFLWLCRYNFAISTSIYLCK